MNQPASRYYYFSNISNTVFCIIIFMQFTHFRSRDNRRTYVMTTSVWSVPVDRRQFLQQIEKPLAIILTVPGILTCSDIIPPLRCRYNYDRRAKTIDGTNIKGIWSRGCPPSIGWLYTAPNILYCTTVYSHTVTCLLSCLENFTWAPWVDRI